MVFSENLEFNSKVRSDSKADADSISTEEIKNQTDIPNAIRGASSDALLPLNAVVESVIPNIVINSEDADHHGPSSVLTYLLFMSRRAR